MCSRMVWAEYLVDGKPHSSWEMVLTEKEAEICITAPNSSCGFMEGSVMYSSSWYRLRTPSMSPASYRLASMD